MGYQLMLRKIRKTKRMTQNELAKAIGSTDRIIGSWERGETDISLEDAFSVCLVLGCTRTTFADGMAKTAAHPSPTAVKPPLTGTTIR